MNVYFFVNALFFCKDWDKEFSDDDDDDGDKEEQIAKSAPARKRVKT